MAVNCAVCNGSMAVAERTVDKKGAAANLHVDCAHRLEMQTLAVVWDKSVKNAIDNEIARLNLRRAGSPTTWP